MTALDIMRRTQFLVFVRETQDPTRKTPTVRVQSRSSGVTLGLIKWYGPWRQFCFYPAPETIFNCSCMSDINGVIADLMAERT